MYYPCFDFAMQSTIWLPELIAVASSGSLPTVEIRIGSIPELHATKVFAEYGLSVSDRAVILAVPNVARYFIRDGQEIIIEPEPDSSDRGVRLYLLGSALGILCLQRGLMLLHANAVAIGDCAAGFAGPSGAGKSTLAAYFLRRSYPILCDDVCAISFDGAGEPLVWPGLPRLKLWGDAARAAGHDPHALDAVIDGVDKYHVPLGAPESRGPLPFVRLYVLDRVDEGGGAVARLRGSDAIAAVMANSYRPEYRAPMGLTRRHFAQCAALLGHIEVYRATRRWGYQVFDEQAGRLEQHLMDLGGRELGQRAMTNQGCHAGRE